MSTGARQKGLVLHCWGKGGVAAGFGGGRKRTKARGLSLWGGRLGGHGPKLQRKYNEL